jgi:hypothetical protein
MLEKSRTPLSKKIQKMCGQKAEEHVVKIEKRILLGKLYR